MTFEIHVQAITPLSLHIPIMCCKEYALTANLHSFSIRSLTIPPMRLLLTVTYGQIKG